ncbi:polymorphic toxin-type HINT domain-containing protein [Sandaracinus amylolyticus]|uniref:polymorphic toxin-type HINT domain-containing protein n=1 Tax=Sandaracinus amylolyticus TaxID=927083 RepID=UPI001F3E4ABA|nr:polymorphic toxin-type HINT domain-containing protein [Sandaracinus amylolyticus]UJR78745.1 Hypothetical protein I5071_7760 [Sandaracinus amylolyticus]
MRLRNASAIQLALLATACSTSPVENAYPGVGRRAEALTLQWVRVDDDTTIYEDDWTNYSDEAYLEVNDLGYPRAISLLNWGITRSGFESLIPPGEEIRSVVLRVPASPGCDPNDPSDTLNLHPVQAPWDPDDVNWSCSDVDDVYVQQCARAWSIDEDLIETPVIATARCEAFSPADNSPWSHEFDGFSFDITAHTVAWLENGYGHDGWSIQGGTRELLSDENGTLLGAGPYVEIVTAPPGAAPNLSPPPLDPAVVTSVWAGYKYLIDQVGQWPTSPSAFDPERVGVLRGRVVARAASSTSTASALPGARVEILGHPEYGHTVTRGDGSYELMVNGGGPAVVHISHTGYLPAQRRVDVPWNSHVMVDAVSLVPAPAATNAACPLVQPGATGQFVSAVSTTPAGLDTTVGGMTSRAGGRNLRIYVPGGVQLSAGSATSTRWRFCGAEYSVEPNASEWTGASTMPGQLPGPTAYTFAAKVRAHLVDSAGNIGDEVEHPTFTGDGVTFWLDNFLGFPDGTEIPYGWYDEQQGRWVAGPDGRVVEVTRLSAGCSYSDASITQAERDAACADLTSGLSVGQSRRYWRVAGARHFSPIDLNLAIALLELFRPALERAADLYNSACGVGSTIRCEERSLGESLPVTGTPYSLTYSSARQRGRADAFSVTVRPLDRAASATAGLAEIRGEIHVAGRRIGADRLFRSSVRPSDCNGVTNCEIQNFSDAATAAALRLNWRWDGMDAVGRRVQGPQRAVVRVAYTYDLGYAIPDPGARSFGRSSGITSAQMAIGRMTTFHEFVTTLGTVDDELAGIGGWNLDVHHVFDPATSTVWLGTGERINAQAAGNVIRTRLAAQAWSDARSVAVDERGDIYYSAFGGADGGIWVRRRGEEVSQRLCPGGDPYGIAVVASVSGGPPRVYFADKQTASVRVIPPNFVGSCASAPLVVGTGVAGSGLGPTTNLIDLVNESPQTFPISQVESIAAGPDGSIYIADRAASRVLRWSNDGTPDGVVELFAGRRSTSCVNGSEPTCIAIETPQAVAVGGDGSVYVAGRIHPRDGASSAQRIIRVHPSGIIEDLLGGATADGSRGDGLSGSAASLGDITGLAIARDGTLVFGEVAAGPSPTVAWDCGEPTQSNCSRIRYIAPNGQAFTMGGIRAKGLLTTFPNTAQGTAATATQIATLRGLGAGPDGRVYFVDGVREEVRVIEPTFPGGFTTDHVVPSPDGSVQWMFDTEGRHLSTRDAISGRSLVAFGYRPDGRLSQVVDPDSTNTISWPASLPGTVTITAPGTLETRLLLGANGYVDRVDYPHATASGTHTDTYEIAHDAGGLLREIVDPARGAGAPEVHSFCYDSVGRLTRDGIGTQAGDTACDAPGASVQTLGSGLAPTPGSAAVVLTNADALSTVLVSRQVGDVLHREVRRPSGARLEINAPADGADLTAVACDSGLAYSESCFDCAARADAASCAAGTACTWTGSACVSSFERMRSVTAFANDPRPSLGGLRYPSQSTLTWFDPLSSAWTTVEATETRTLGASGAPCNGSASCLQTAQRVVGSGTAATVLEQTGTTWRITELAPSVPLTTTRTVAHPELRVRRTLLDSAGRPTRVENPGEHPVCISYTGDRVSAVVQAANCIVSGSYRRVAYGYGGPSSRFLASVTEGTTVTSYARDQRGWIENITLPGTATGSSAPRVVQLTYDAEGNTTGVLTPTARQHGYTYGILDSVATYSPPATAAWSLTPAYDVDYTNAGTPDLYTLRSATGPATDVLDPQYDASTGALASIADSVGATLYEVDEDYAGRVIVSDDLTRVRLARTFAGPFLRREEWTRDVSGRVDHLFDNRGLLIAESASVDLGASQQTYSESSCYNTDRELQTLVLDGAGVGESFAIAYAGGTAPSATLTTRVGPLTTGCGTVSGAHVLVSTTANSFGELASRSASFVSGGSSSFYTLTIPETVGSSAGRDLNGRIRFREEKLGAQTTCDAYVYDSAAHLSSWTRTSGLCGTVGAPVLGTATYGYDANGNLSASTIDWDGAGTSYASQTTNYSLTEQDQPRNGRVPGATSTTARSYDAAGRLETRGSNADPLMRERFVYDSFDRLVRWCPTGACGTTASNRVDLSYDGVGRLVRIYEASANIEQRFYYRDGLAPIAWQQIASSVRRTVVFGYGSYDWVPDVMYVDTTTNGGVDETYRIVHDERGSVRAIVRAAGTGTIGALVQRFSYDPWGNRRAAEEGTAPPATATSTQPFGFAGAIALPIPGIWHMGARQYDSTVGAFTTRDPIEFGGGVSHYAYVAGDPVNAVDPGGLNPAILSQIGCLGSLAVNGGSPAEVAFNIVVGAVLEGLAAFRALGRAAPGAGALDDACRGGMCEVPGRCFAAGTPVETSEGLRGIEDVEVGDLVWSLDPDTGESGYREVTRTFERIEDVVLELSIVADNASESITTTRSHPFYVANRGWVRAEELRTGDEVFTSRGGWARIASGTWIEASQLVYNLEVEGSHSYFVGQAGVWAHNSCVQANKAAGDAFRDQVADGFRQMGYDVQTEVTVVTPFGVRRYDVAISSGGTLRGLIETKVGRSPYLPSQRAKDAWVASGPRWGRYANVPRVPTTIVRP